MTCLGTTICAGTDFSRFFSFGHRSQRVPHYTTLQLREGIHMKTGGTVGVWNYSTQHGQFGHDMKFVVDGTGDSMGFFLASFFFFFNNIYPFVQSLSLHTGHVPSTSQCLIISDRF